METHQLGRILVVDDDEGMRSELQRTLESRGFEVVLGTDCRTGFECFEQELFDLILLDCRMPDFDGEMAEDGGILLLKRIGPSDSGREERALIWVITATVSAETKEAAMRYGADRYIDKAEFYLRRDQQLRDISKMIEARRAQLAAFKAASHEPTQPDAKEREKLMQEEPNPGSVGKRQDRANEKNRSPATGSVYPAQLALHVSDGLILNDQDREVLVQLYSDCAEISASPLASKLTKSKVFRVDGVDRHGRRLIPFVTKIGSKKQIVQEYENFRKYVQNQLGSARYGEIKEVKYSRDRERGGFRMNFVGTDLDEAVDLQTFIERNEIHEVEEALDNLFGGTFCPWHRAKQPAVPLGIIEAYDLFGGPNRIRGAIERFFKNLTGRQLLEFELHPRPIYHPAEALGLLSKELSGLKRDSHISTTHGDLNVTNILVDSRFECWLLDFAATAEGPILRDFIELETSIKYGCHEGPVEDLWYLEQALMKQEHFRDKPQLVHNDPQLRKIFAAVSKVREYAYLANAPSREMTEYYIGLLFYTLGLVRFNNKVLSLEKKKCLMLASALLFDKFKKPGARMGFVDPSKVLTFRRREEDRRRHSILIVDDEKHQRNNLAAILKRTGELKPTTAEDSISAIALLDEADREFDLCIIDMEMPGLDGSHSKTAGLDLLRYLRVRSPLMPTIVLSATSDVQVAVNSIRRDGAVTFFGKAEVARDRHKGLVRKIMEVIQERIEERRAASEKQRMIELIRSARPADLPDMDSLDVALHSESADEVGGDLWDLKESEGGSLQVMIGDVTGHGFPAAVLMTQLYSHYHEAGLPEAAELTDRLAKWNLFILDKKISSELVPLFLAVLDPSTGLLSYANAGHPAPFIVSADGEIRYLDATGPLLGVLAGARYSAKTESLSPGDTVVLYTDGFTEARNGLEAEFGLERLQNSVRSLRSGSAEQIKNSVVSEARAFVEAGKFADDVTLIVIKVLRRAPDTPESSEYESR